MIAQLILSRFEIAMPDAVDNLETNNDIEIIKHLQETIF